MGLGNITLNSTARQLSQPRMLQMRRACLTELHFIGLVILIQSEVISVNVSFSMMMTRSHCLLYCDWPLPFVVLTKFHCFLYICPPLCQIVQQKYFSGNICSVRRRKALETLKGKIWAHFRIYFPTFSKLSKAYGLLGI